VWLHGCGGYSEFDIDSFHAAPAEDYITIAPFGAEGACWYTPNNGGQGDERIVERVVEDARRHFNIDVGNVVVGGYSSGGDLAYRMAYLYPDMVKTVLVANSSPFKDTGLTPAVLSGVNRKAKVVHLAHTGDDLYKIAEVKSELQILTTAGFDVTLVERPGGHYDDPGPGVPGTDEDIRTYLLPQVDPAP
jgi:predicted esterase